MREIKFRAWNSIDKKMVGWCSLKHSFDAFIKSKHYELMQFTGLTDKNGVDIYEGDILESVSEMVNVANYPVKTGEMKRTLKVVSYDDSKGAFVTPNSIVATMSQSIISKYSIVVGNIHQNHELLENKSEN